MTAYRGAGIIVSRADRKFYNPKKGSKIRGYSIVLKEL